MSRQPSEVGPIQLRSRVTGEIQAPVSGGPGSLHSSEEEPTGSTSEELDRLVPLLTAIRWATTAVSLLLLSSAGRTGTTPVIGAAVLSYSLCRTLWPLDFSEHNRERVWALVAEGVVMGSAVVGSGYWDSPFVFGLVTVICAAGFAGGLSLALKSAALCLVTVAVGYHLTNPLASGEITLRWAGELALVAVLAGHVRRLSLQAGAETSRYQGRLRQLSDVNDLLLKLRRMAHTLPMSLDLEETLESSSNRMRELLRPDSLAILLRNDETWSLAMASGMQLSQEAASADLPPVLRRVVESAAPVVAVTDEDGAAAMLGPGSRAALYARLAARGELIGMVAVERREDRTFSADDVALLEELCQQMAIAIDNARWFTRIGTLAAEQERSRIARDLHDRVGQSLALVGFELDRVARKSNDPAVRTQLLELRENVRSVVTELRETLHDLRTDVSEDRDLTLALGEFLDRVGQRSGLAVALEHQVTRRLSLTVEREVWRIAQEAVFNAERHARASWVKVTWTSDDEGAELKVSDDGEGMPLTGSPSRSYGILGMHERAEAIGASLEFDSYPNAGTTVSLTLRR